MASTKARGLGLGNRSRRSLGTCVPCRPGRADRTSGRSGAEWASDEVRKGLQKAPGSTSGVILAHFLTHFHVRARPEAVSCSIFWERRTQFVTLKHQTRVRVNFPRNLNLRRKRERLSGHRKSKENKEDRANKRKRAIIETKMEGDACLRGRRQWPQAI